MYIRKTRYYILRMVSGFGSYFWGSLVCAMFLGMIMDLCMGNVDFMQANIPTITCIMFVLWILHLFLHYWTGKLKVYNGIFSNDADGVIQVRVIAKALGLEEEKVLSDLRFLQKLSLLKDCTLRKNDADVAIVILGDAVVPEHAQAGEGKLVRVICPQCGGANDIRPGFVTPCRYCSGSLDGGRREHVSE